MTVTMMTMMMIDSIQEYVTFRNHCPVCQDFTCIVTWPLQDLFLSNFAHTNIILPELNGKDGTSRFLLNILIDARSKDTAVIMLYTRKLRADSPEPILREPLHDFVIRAFTLSPCLDHARGVPRDLCRGFSCGYTSLGQGMS